MGKRETADLGNWVGRFLLSPRCRETPPPSCLRAGKEPLKVIKRTDILATIHEIEGDHKARHVAYFKSIEGEDTDEKNAQGRTVKVELKYYATLAGIAPETFRRWVRKASENPTVVLSASKQKTREIEAWHIRSALRNRPETIVDGITELPEQQQAAIINRVVERFPKRPRPAPTSRPDALGVLDVITECRKAVSALSSAAGAVGMTDWDEETREAIHEIVAQMENYVSAIRSLVDGFDPEELLK